MKQKRFFEILVASIVFVLAVLGINFQAYASITTSTNTGSITVSKIEAGAEVSIYQLTTVNYDYTLNQPQAVPYTWVSSVKTWLDANYSNYADPEEFYNDITSNSSESKAFYSDLAAAIKGNEITLTATKTESALGTASYPVTEDKLTGSVTFTGCEMGTYLVLIENGYMVYTPSVVNLTPEFNNSEDVKEWELASNVDVQVKSTKPQIKKTVTDTTLQADNYSVIQDITYILVSDIPNYEENSLATNYCVSDVLRDGLVFDATSIEVYGVKGTAEQKLTEGYILVTSNATRPNGLGNATFSLNFTYSDIKAYDSIKVVYKAILDKSISTVYGSAGNNNTAYLDYSNNPYDVSSYQSQECSSVVYTYGIEITTIDKTTKDVLSGAEYILSDSNGKLYFVAGDQTGEYYLAESTEQGATTNLVCDSNGKLYIYGVDEATYILEQTKAPEQYNIATDKPEIIIIDDDTNGALDDEEGTTGIYKLNVPNSKGFTLPVTGGIGTTIFAAMGIVFVGLGLILLIVVIKRSRTTK